MTVTKIMANVTKIRTIFQWSVHAIVPQKNTATQAMMSDLQKITIINWLF